MKKKSIALRLVPLSFLLMVAVFVTDQVHAQSKKKTVKVITHHHNKDTINNHNVVVYHHNGDEMTINIDSLVTCHTKGFDKQMRVFALKIDSLQDFEFDFDDDLEKMHIELERLLQEKGLHLDELKHLHKAGDKRIAFLSGDDAKIDVEEFVDEDGEHIKIIRREIKKDDDSNGVHTYVISSDPDRSMALHKRRLKVSSIPIEDLSVLTKAGVSHKQLLGEQLSLDDIKVQLKTSIEDKMSRIILQIECELPKGKYQMEMINKTGKVVEEKKNMKAGAVKEEFDLKKEEAPYYLILSGNNQLFGRKIVL